MKSEDFKKMVAKAEKDPNFLHDLIYNPEKTVASLKDMVSREQLGRIVGNSPIELIAKTIGVNAACGTTCASSCGYTCGSGSCAHTTSLQGDQLDRGMAYVSIGKQELAWCEVTCVGGTCGTTCVGGTCGETSVGVTADPFGLADQFVSSRFGFQRFR